MNAAPVTTPAVRKAMVDIEAARAEGYAAGYEIGLIAGSERARAACIAALRSLATVLESEGPKFQHKPPRRGRKGRK